ncbi:unnamed protein product [Oppiella nova]|uniref:ABC transporter family G domain-containing protein n=1 Tax=Oppiella nova TaxID=334625 RepID=A0A7R9QRZ4_9ACAR|nr:unnamed protein product [Oppiella nova]CAG2172835.1 unnamed protein product [Oppiella nova]
MSSLVISDTADNRVETCSGGEHKRIVIACELTAHIKPNMLCIDEPTSGLDSSAALVVINCLKVLSRRHGMTIIASIHQPNNDLFHMFDNIYVLAKGGHCLYDGVPHQLRQHLIDCDITVDNIYVLAKGGHCLFDGVPHQLRQHLIDCDITVGDNEVPIEVLLKMASKDNTNNSSQEFSLTYTFRCQWLSLLLLFSTFQMLALIMKSHYPANMIEPDSCMELEFGADCNQTEVDIEETSLIKQNIKYNVSMLTCFGFIVAIVMLV